MASKVTPVENIESQSFCNFLDSKLQEFFSKQPTVSILEVGCGTGALAFILQEKYKQKIVYKAIDPIKEATDKAKARGVEGVEAISLGDLSSSENTYDIVMCTKSFHHLPSLHEALVTIHKILKPGGLFLADEFAREAMDVQTAKFLYGRMDDLEAAGKFHSSSKWPASEDIKHDYLKRWHSKFLPQQQGGTGEAFSYGPFKPHSHGAHAGHAHADTHEHPHHGSHASQGTQEIQPAHATSEAHMTHGTHGTHGTHETHGSHGSHGSHGAHGAHGAHGHHHHVLPTSDEMINEIKKVFPNLEVAQCGFLYHFIGQRFDGSTMGEDIVKEFKSEEEDLIAKKQIVAIGLRFTCSKV